jgi:hypothetical protein
LNELPVTDPRASLAAERGDLLSLLEGLTEAEWLATTEAGHWRVKDVALHLLDDDLGWLSRGRDGDTSGLLSTEGDYREFVRALDEKNERWVVGASGLSRRVVTDLLRWSGDEVGAYYDSVELHDPTGVIWASGSAVPRWLDLSRDLTERWVHQQHIRDAVNRPGHHDRFLPEVLGTFVWAFPHQYEAPGKRGTTVQIDFGSCGTWHLKRVSDGWELNPGRARSPSASVRIAPEMAWRQMTGLPVPDEAIATEGPESLTRRLLAVRAIIV